MRRRALLLLPVLASARGSAASSGREVAVKMLSPPPPPLAPVVEQLRVTGRVIDKVAAAGTIHRNKAARLKSRLARRVNKLAASA